MSELSSRPQRYMISQRQDLGAQNLAPMSLQQVEDILKEVPDVTVIRKIPPPGLGIFSTVPDTSPGVIVATMTEATANKISQSPRLFLEVDRRLTLANPSLQEQKGVINPSNIRPFGSSLTYRISVLGEHGQGVNNARVYLHGDAGYAVGMTSGDGSLAITLETYAHTEPASIYVVPQSGYWEKWIDEPELDVNGVSTISLLPLADTYPELPKKEYYGWGQIAMGLPEVDPSLRGAGVKVAIIDSGTDNGHPDLAHVHEGQDFTVVPPNSNWTDDTISHGSHCAGVITGSSENGGIRGFAPDAEVFSLKILPDGYFSSLVESINYCIDNSIDIINMSIGGAHESRAVMERLSVARQNGITCIAAAGNTASDVQFPGSSPDVLTVSAIGKYGTYPQDSNHARQVGFNEQTVEGHDRYFTAAFTCHGPKVDVCGPGVAILSTVPGKGFAVWDGTSMAAPHITGLAALILAHNPDFQEKYQTRNTQRVDELCMRITQSAERVEVGNVNFTGWGLPNVKRALQPLSSSSTNPAGSKLLQAIGVELPSKGSDLRKDIAENSSFIANPVDHNEALSILRERLAKIDTRDSLM